MYMIIYLIIYLIILFILLIFIWFNKIEGFNIRKKAFDPFFDQNNILLKIILFMINQT